MADSKNPSAPEKVLKNDFDFKEVSASVQRRISQLLIVRNHSLPLFVHNSNTNFSNSRFKVPPAIINKTEWKFSLPTPVFTSSTGFLEIDPISRRVSEHRSYQNKLTWIPSTYKTWEEKKVYRNARKRGIYSCNILNYAELLELNPDEYFSGRYDWFYTGGNLETFDYGDEKYVVHATGKRLQDLNVSKADINFNHIKLTNISRKRSKVLISGNKNPEILEIQNLNGTNISVRRRNYISLYSYEDDTLKYRYHLYNKSLPFISSTKESPTSANVVTADLNKTVALWDLNASAQTPKSLLLKSTANTPKIGWNCVRYIDDHIYAFVDADNFYMLDSRLSSEENNKHFSVKVGNDPCEQNTMISSSNFSDLIYLATTHKLFALDRRFMKANLNETRKASVLRWTHQMDGYPLMLRTTLLHDIETIVMASYTNGDICVCQNNKITLRNKEIVYTSPNLPIRPPSIKEAYRNARREGLCLNPYTSLEERLNYLHSGLCFINSDDLQAFLTSNSNGDIFAQVGVDAHELNMVNEDNLAAMKQWHDTVLDMDSKNHPPLNVTNVHNLESLRKVFRCDQLETGREDNERIDEYATTTPRRGKWQRPLKMLKRYKDALATDLLSIWDIEAQDKEDAERLVLPEQDVTSQGTEVVDQWLEQNTIAVVDESVLSSMKIGLDDTVVANEAVVSAVDPVTAQKKDKKALKRQYVKGF